MSTVPMYTVRLRDESEFGPATIEMIAGWARQGRVPRDAELVPAEGGPTRAVVDDPTIAAVFRAPPTMPNTVVQSDPVGGPSAVETLIPFRNPAALTAYYLAVFALVPFFGIVLAIPAIVLGVIGLRRCRKEPRCRGKVHAWIGIAGGTLLALAWIGLLVVISRSSML